MSDRLDPKDFGLKLYNRFPPSYRADDVGQKYALRGTLKPPQRVVSSTLLKNRMVFLI